MRRGSAVSRHLNDDAAAQKLNGNIRDRKADHQQDGRYVQRAGVIFIVKKINRSTVVPQTALLPQRLAEHTKRMPKSTFQPSAIQ